MAIQAEVLTNFLLFLLLMYPMNSFKHHHVFLALMLMMLCAPTPVSASGDSEQAIPDVWPDEFVWLFEIND